MWTLQQMQQRLNHSRIDLLKMDIEGWEWPLIQSWPDFVSSPQEAEQAILPMQILVEVSTGNMPEIRTGSGVSFLSISSNPCLCRYQ